MNAPLYLSTGILSLGNGALIFAINPGRAINRVFFFASAWISLWFFSVFMAMQAGAEYIGGSPHPALFWLRLSAVVAAFSGWVIWLMRSALLSSTEKIQDIFARSWPWFFVCGAIACIPFMEGFMPADPTPGVFKHGPAYFAYVSAVGVCCLGLLADALHTMRHLTGAKRIELQFFVFNAICACFLILLSGVLGRLLNLRWPRLFGPVAFSLMHALTLWAICSHRIFDAKQVIVSIARRALFFCILGGGTLGALAGISGLISGPFDLLIAVCIGGALALTCERALTKWLNLDPELMLLKPRRALIERARGEPDTENVRTHFHKFLCDWCHTERVEFLSPRGGGYVSASLALPANWAGLSCLCRDGWLTPESLQRKRLEAGTEACAELMSKQGFGALLAVPRNTDRPSLVVALGRRHSLRPYTYPDIRQLVDLVELMDSIVARATLSRQMARLAGMESAMVISRSLAHDLNNLTTPVASYLLHTQGRAKPGSAEAEVHEAALQSVKVMNDYIRESLFFSRQLSPEIKTVNPDEILASLSTLTHERAGRGQVSVQVSSEACATFNADPTLLRRLALNLVNNAIDASPAGATVTVKLFPAKAGAVALSVSDQGAGVSTENQQRIFDPYFTTKNTGDANRGLGLGLAICRKIAEVHGGEIQVDSQPGHGATFTATFPQSAKAQSREKPRTALWGSSATSRKPSRHPLLNLKSFCPWSQTQTPW